MKNKSYSLVFSSIASVIAFILLYISAVVPTGSLASFGLSIFALCVIVAECGIKWGLLGGVVAGLLGFIFIPNKLILLPYALFFGYYPALKLCIEHLDKLWLEWVLKMTAFTIAMLAVYMLARLFMPNFSVGEYPVYIVAVIMEVVFALYDIVLTQTISIYITRISNKIRKGK